MITREHFLEVAEEAFANPRTGPYDVHPLHSAVRAYPFRTDEGVVPAVVLQFAVENRHDSRARRVISLSRSELGYAVWCGDRFTEGRLAESLDIDDVIADALLQIPPEHAHEALHDMESIEGSYPHFAHCHFWQAWHSHHGVCKHVAATIQWIEANYDGGLDGALDDLDDTYQHLTNPQVHLDLDLSGVGTPVNKTRIRGEILALVTGVTAPVGGLTGAQYDVLSELLDQLAE